MTEDRVSQPQGNGISAIEPMTAMRWRCIGPPRGGRVVAVAGDPEDPAVFYFGACAGGVWKTTDAGTYWENVSDGFFRTSAVGAIAVADIADILAEAGEIRQGRLEGLPRPRRQHAEPSGPRHHVVAADRGDQQFCVCLV